VVSDLVRLLLNPINLKIDFDFYRVKVERGRAHGLLMEYLNSGGYPWLVLENDQKKAAAAVDKTHIRFIPYWELLSSGAQDESEVFPPPGR
jgi:hypothetical protein